MISPQELIERITEAADYDDCFVIVEHKSQSNLRWASSTLTTNGVISEQSVTVIAFVAVDGGMATGSITRTDVTADEYLEIARIAGATARAAGKAEDAADLLTDSHLGDWTAAHSPTAQDIFDSFAPALGDMFQKSHADSIELFGYAEHTHTTTWIGSKGGLRLRHDQPAGRVEMTGKSHNRSRSTWEGRATRDFSDISIAVIDAGIRQRLDWQAHTSHMKPGHYQTVVPAGAVADLMAYILYASPGRDAHEGRSVFSKKGESGKTRIGETLSNLPIDLYCDASYPGLEASPFNVATASSSYGSVFDNGIPLTSFDFMRGGKLQNLITTRATANATGLPFAPAGDNLVMELPGASGDLSDMIAKIKNGLLLTTLWYIRTVDPVTYLLTGLTRDGVYHIKDGEVLGAVNNFRWNESPVDLLSRISTVGATEITATRELEDFGRTATPPVIFDDFNMSTVSQAN